ncbi:hypothetical protein C8Q72DRAFT_955078 [Fomitopsis betulina]|nr:hypothetical protein C8Q72DRAFT_955078 [Fomitopsis betulina]
MFVSSMLEKLNEDILSYMIRGLPAKDIRSCAQTCRWFREAATPLLYERTCMTVFGPTAISEPRRFCPTSLRSYIRFLTILDQCFGCFPENRRSLCCLYDPLGDRLRELPNLRSLRLFSYIMRSEEQRHGIPWNTMYSILSVPHLREFELRNIHICPSLRPGESINVGPLASPITSFRYKPQPRDHPSFPLEIAALAAILESLCGTLETLALMTESAPLSVMAKLDWPRLRNISFYGSPLLEPIVPTCFGMRHLRSLSLSINGMPPMVLPAGSESTSPPTFPWPELERLSVSYPDPQDRMYDCLPSTLRSLSLRCWYYQHFEWHLRDVGMAYRQTRYSMPSSSGMISILRRCSMLTLEHLQVQYVADDADDAADDAVLQYLVVTFPHLQSLKIHRYIKYMGIAEGEPDAPVQRVARLLAPLTKLRRLKIFLDWYGSMETNSTDVALDVARIFASALGNHLRVIAVLSEADDPTWRTFIVDGGDVLEEREVPGLRLQHNYHI